jgi:hypothetical protein
LDANLEAVAGPVRPTGEPGNYVVSSLAQDDWVTLDQAEGNLLPSAQGTPVKAVPPSEWLGYEDLSISITRPYHMWPEEAACGWPNQGSNIPHRPARIYRKYNKEKSRAQTVRAYALCLLSLFLVIATVGACSAPRADHKTLNASYSTQTSTYYFRLNHHMILTSCIRLCRTKGRHFSLWHSTHLWTLLTTVYCLPNNGRKLRYKAYNLRLEEKEDCIYRLPPLVMEQNPNQDNGELPNTGACPVP